MSSQNRNLSIQAISSEMAMRLVEQYHYSHRRVGARHAFGLFDGRELIGCCVFSIPASYTLCKGVCGQSYKQQVIELSRLVVIPRERNLASRLISDCCRTIGKISDSIIVSYADGNEHVGHVGYVYQACNWIYTGTGNAEPAWLHPLTKEVVSYTRRHIDLKAKALGYDWRDLIKQPQIGKHRYVTFCGSKAFRKEAKSNLRYPVLSYPKGLSKTHPEKINTNMLF